MGEACPVGMLFELINLTLKINLFNYIHKGTLVIAYSFTTSYHCIQKRWILSLKMEQMS